MPLRHCAAKGRMYMIRFYLTEDDKLKELDEPQTGCWVSMIEELDALRSAWPGGKRKYLDAYKRDCLTPGNKVLVISGAGEREAFADSVDDDFRLVVILPDGSREAVSSGEVSVRGLYGYTW